MNSWVGEAMKREKSGERVFESRSRAKETGKICGMSKTQVIRLKSKHDSHHMDETGIEREISEVSKNMGRPRIELDNFDKAALSRLILVYYLKPQPEIPTLAKIHTDALKMPGFPAMSIATLSRWVKNLGLSVSAEIESFKCIKDWTLLPADKDTCDVYVSYGQPAAKLFMRMKPGVMLTTP